MKQHSFNMLLFYQSLLSYFSAEVHTAKASYFHNKINSASDTCIIFKTFNSLLCPPPPPSTTSLTADYFATFFTNKTSSISSQFSAPHMQEFKPTTSISKTPLFAFCPLTEGEVSKLLLSSHPTTCPLDPISAHLLQAISPSLFKSSYLHSVAFLLASSGTSLHYLPPILSAPGVFINRHYCRLHSTTGRHNLGFVQTPRWAQRLHQ